MDQLLAELLRGADPEELHQILLGPGTRGDADQRIREVMDMILDDPAVEVGAAQLAAETGLSTSRFLRLFTAGAGTSFRRYRLWSRLLSVAAAVADGSNLTTAAITAGFASPATSATPSTPCSA